MEELDHTPDTSFERDVVCEDEDAFCLSLENIATLQKLLRQVMSTQIMAWDLQWYLAIWENWQFFSFVNIMR